MKFSQDIDNLTTADDVYNFMIGPVYGHLPELENDKPKPILSSLTRPPIGIVQFVNKKEYKPITDYD